MKHRPGQEAGQKLGQAKKIFLLSSLLTLFFSVVMAVTAFASDFTINVSPGDTAGNVGPIELIFIFAFLALLPSIVLMMTSFTRIIIVFGFLRSAMGTNQSPPNMVLTGLSIFLTLFIMMPVFQEMYTAAAEPFIAGDMDTAQALDTASKPLKKFMLLQMDSESLNMFLEIAKIDPPQVADPADPVELLDLPITVVTPAFMVSEISRAFMMGFLLFLPFLIIDLVVSSILMSMGMMMLPPAMISLPFKLMMFVLVDGWDMLIGTLVRSYQI